MIECFGLAEACIGQGAFARAGSSYAHVGMKDPSRHASIVALHACEARVGARRRRLYHARRAVGKSFCQRTGLFSNPCSSR